MGVECPINAILSSNGLYALRGNPTRDLHAGSRPSWRGSGHRANGVAAFEGDPIQVLAGDTRPYVAVSNPGLLGAEVGNQVHEAAAVHVFQVPARLVRRNGAGGSEGRL